jgi:hypothetical protein
MLVIGYTTEDIVDLVEMNNTYAEPSPGLGVRAQRRAVRMAAAGSPWW